MALRAIKIGCTNNHILQDEKGLKTFKNLSKANSFMMRILLCTLHT